MTSNNPFNVALNEPIDYANVTGNAIDEYVEVTLQNIIKDVETIKNLNEPTFESTFSAYDHIRGRIKYVLKMYI